MPSAVRDAQPLRSLQERAARAQPAAHVEHLDGWWLRHDADGAWWLGSVLPHAPAGRDGLARRIDASEAFYAARGANARFQVCPGACPHALDAALARRSYRGHDPMSLQVARTADVLARTAATTVPVRLHARPTQGWFAAWRAVHAHGDPRAAADMLTRVARPAAYATVAFGDDVVAVGRGVADTGWVGVFGMVTVARARGRGAARAVLTALAGWAADLGVARMYLQVERGNGTALRLYERMGFSELCGYHYRTAG